MLLIILLWVIGCIALVYLTCKHFIHTKEFNPLWFTLDEEVKKAEKRQIKPLFDPYKVPFTHELSYWIKWLTLIVVLALLFSCSPMKSGYYTVQKINGSTTIQLKEVKGDWHIEGADSLKVGQRIYLNRTKETAKVNVW